MAWQILSESRCFGGTQQVRGHRSAVLDCDMRLGVYLPPGVDLSRAPVLIYLSGLTCTEQNVLTKSGIQRACAAHGVILLAPDTSPRGDLVADDEAWDLGQGAGFYVHATQAPWAAHYRMDAYILQEVVALARSLSHGRVGVTGHSMGGHGAITLGLKRPDVFASVSALAPILQPCDVPWGRKAFSAYLGPDRSTWEAWDARHLVARHRAAGPILIDQGDADGFLGEQLVADGFLAAARSAGQDVTYRLQPGYDHGYYFVSTFIDDHVAWHAERLKG